MADTGSTQKQFSELMDKVLAEGPLYSESIELWHWCVVDLNYYSIYLHHIIAVEILEVAAAMGQRYGPTF